MSIEEVTDIIDAITAEDMALLADELLRSNKVRLSVVGPVKSENNLVELLKI